ncbi:response regulator [Paenibacillus soyae]|uniref:Response regulator n=1 Tax=Paenibacillus soyae TaxID=2969249 RepID=A0A9X2S8I6_9BACL|nr:response regulator [Paenibacillus soyae]MCR2804275.1 response regulator [Paenibacillus soyae]
MAMFKVIIVDDELLMRIGIRSMIEWEEHGFRLAGEAANGREALDLSLRVGPDLIITDIKMPIMDGLSLIREVSKALNHCKFVILSNFDEIGYVKEALRLGASDYIIKSEITKHTLTDLLAGLREKLQPASGAESAPFRQPMDYTESLTHLKERLFKDLISGLLDEKEASAKAEQLQARVRSDRLVLAKLRIDRFGDVKKKYVEKDERLLRFSVRNIMEEIIPSSRNTEVIVESSSEYLLIHNPTAEDAREARKEIGKLCGSIASTMKDFMNISISAGISTVVSGFREVKQAYREADLALSGRFFRGIGQLAYYEDLAGLLDRESIDTQLEGEPALVFRDALESMQADRVVSFLDGFRRELEAMHVDEKSIRKAYIRLAEIVNSQSSRSRQSEDLSSPYEDVLTAETWDDIHEIVSEYACRTVTDGRPSDQASYAEMAAELIHRYYAEDISLQSVAAQINVHPSYLSRVFKQEKGENFISYLTRIRIERAKSFLESRHYKIYEVADKVGYHNYTYFSKLFKKIVGLSPEEFRG